MKKTLIFAAMALVAMVGCQQIENDGPKDGLQEISFTPLAGNVPTRGYSTGTSFDDTKYEDLVATSPSKTDRTMQISAYHNPQNGASNNYFVNKTYKSNGTHWSNHEGDTPTPLYWPVGGKLDFLAYSLSAEVASVKNVNAVWNTENAASQVVLDVPGENTQNDILFASAYDVKSSTGANPVPMKFKHAQAWIQFQLKGIPDDIITLKKIELEDVYNAGVLTIDNNQGNATATWDFSAEKKNNIEVDNNRTNPVTKLTSTVGQLDMLIPQQKKTAFVIYYTLANDPQVLTYRFETDLKTWLMGEKYVYKITMKTNEILVDPSVTDWVLGVDENGTASIE